MHSLKVVHRDIKPDNIMYSKSFKKHVFIDFGGSVLLKESIGEKSLTKFLGTTGFCS
jgi:serine/threonine protein kinase